MIFHSLRHWVLNYHVDGFRFDLASILSRGRNGEMLPNPPIIELIADDPVLADTKIIAEAWDAAGLYQVMRTAYKLGTRAAATQDHFVPAVVWLPARLCPVRRGG